MSKHQEQHGKASSKIIVFDSNTEVLTAYEGGKSVFVFDGISGADGHETTRGTYRILRKYQKYWSKTYNAPMDYAMFFSNDGKAIHKFHGPFGLDRFIRRNISNSFGSHGCIRLREEDVKQLYDWAPVGTVVQIR